MKSIIFVSLFLLSGCASVSEYSQGCRDGIAFGVKNINEQLAKFFTDVKLNIDQERLKNSCDQLDKNRTFPNHSAPPHKD